jgi:hypothetical protein
MWTEKWTTLSDFASGKLLRNALASHRTGFWELLVSLKSDSTQNWEFFSHLNITPQCVVLNPGSKNVFFSMKNSNCIASL